MTSPTQRSLKKLRDAGYLCYITEHWNPWARVRQDLFGFVDILAVRGIETLGVQTTSGGNVNARIKKINDSPNLKILKGANWKIVVHGWRKLKSGWECREEYL